MCYLREGSTGAGTTLSACLTAGLRVSDLLGRVRGQEQGPLFLNRFGEPITARGFAYQLKKRALECKVDADLVHPQALKNLFARCFLEAVGDMRFLDELLG